ncbi:hypothetical protein I7I50_04103 [Histoplasma capsulatum G186AR]|uniref:Uncharacterized protein n=1 Tax=Ajellomyces capsulatus TaxID=5037 RepID=A0A8H8CYR5_AJECA|nr:hypothetical protein I7I52_05011 [Histoplasma capsulatum]QSS75080.1 hypothetical protein I7I50_04103 [Histoplasma capsulatum G186AR]
MTTRLSIAKSQRNYLLNGSLIVIYATASRSIVGNHIQGAAECLKFLNFQKSRRRAENSLTMVTVKRRRRIKNKRNYFCPFPCP